MSRIVSKAIAYSYEGTTMLGELVIDAAISGRRPGVLVVHEAFGLGDHAIGKAQRLAELGYAAFALDLWGDRTQITEMPKVMDTIGAITADRATWMGRVGAALEALKGEAEVDAGRLAAIGYCFGGATVLEYARSGAPLKGVASFHGALNPVGADWSSQEVGAKLLVCTGADDPLVPRTVIDAFQDNLAGSGVDWEIIVYSGTKHSFTNVEADGFGMSEMIGYQAQSDARSWDRLKGFLEEMFAAG